MATEDATTGVIANKQEDGTEETHFLQDDDLAQEIGLNAYEYLEECFYNEVSVLDRDKFDAIPEVVKADLTILVSTAQRDHLHASQLRNITDRTTTSDSPVTSLVPSTGLTRKVHEFTPTACCCCSTFDVKERQKLSFTCCARIKMSGRLHIIMFSVPPHL